MFSFHDRTNTAAPCAAPASLALAVALTLAAPLAAQAAEGLRVVRDPLTGELRGPNAAEAAAFEKAEAALRARNRQTVQQVEVQHADGSVETKLGDDTRMYSVVREGPNGSLIMQCLPGKEAERFVGAAKDSRQTFAKAKARASHASR